MNRFSGCLRGNVIVVAIVILLVGCTGLSPEPRNYSEPGPHEVQVKEQITLSDREQEREVTMRVVWPDGPGPYPVIVFSHGAFCYPQQYANITDFWVSHGYIVILPDHLDSPNGPKMSPTSVTKMLSSRSRDMSFVLDSLDQIEQQVPELKGRIARDKAVVAGHSFGGMIAMVKTGLRMESQVDGQPVVMADDRFQAAVVMSGVGQMEPMKPFPEVSTMSADAFAGLQRPLIASGGTLDVGNVGTGEIYPWQWRMAAYILAPPGDKYSLVLENADHYLGGLICRENRGGEDDPVAVEVVRTAQTAFLDAYIKDDSGARDWLRSNNFDELSHGRADFEYK